jgi:hypothetical protein
MANSCDHGTLRHMVAEIVDSNPARNMVIIHDISCCNVNVERCILRRTGPPFQESYRLSKRDLQNFYAREDRLKSACSVSKNEWSLGYLGGLKYGVTTNVNNA